MIIQSVSGVRGVMITDQDRKVQNILMEGEKVRRAGR